MKPRLIFNRLSNNQTQKDKKQLFCFLFNTHFVLFLLSPRVMACCLKFFLLVSILLSLHAHLISAKQYHFKACWDSHQFEAVLEKYCSSFFVRKRSIGREGKETRFVFFLVAGYLNSTFSKSRLSSRTFIINSVMF